MGVDFVDNRLLARLLVVMISKLVGFRCGRRSSRWVSGVWKLVLGFWVWICITCSG